MKLKRDSEKELNLKISEVKIRLLDQSEDSLIGWASCVINDSLYLNNISLRYSREGSVILAFPGTRSKKGKLRYFYFNPISHKAAEILKEAIIGKLKLSGEDKDR